MGKSCRQIIKLDDGSISIQCYGDKSGLTLRDPVIKIKLKIIT
jgi:hypothetical protein